MYEMHINLEIMQEVILPKEINIIKYQECCLEKGAKINAALNPRIMINLVKHQCIRILRNNHLMY